MRRFGWMLLAAALLLALGCAGAVEAPAAGVDSWPGVIVRMNVESEESVPVYREPDASAQVVACLEPGSFVYDCRRVPGGFVRCGTDDEIEGYVAVEHLREPAFRIRTSEAAGEDEAILDDLSELSEDRWKGAEQMPVRCGDRKVYCVEEYERHCVSCFDGAGRFVWGLYTDVLDSATEDAVLQVFAGGELDGRAMICVVNGKLGLAAIDVETGALLWTIDRGEEFLCGAHACAPDGTLYINCMMLDGSSEQVAAISPDGVRLWMSDVPREAGWLCEVRLEGDRIVAAYGDESLEMRTVWIDAHTGAVIAIEPDDL